MYIFYTNAYSRAPLADNPPPKEFLDETTTKILAKMLKMYHTVGWTHWDV